MSLQPFHLAVPVRDLDETPAFYENRLGCTRGRTAARWIDLNFFGHQLTLHLADNADAVAHNPVDGDAVPARHFGIILEPAQWRALADQLTDAQCRFLIEPRTRFVGQVGEQSTLFLFDPSGNALEFKSFADHKQIFAR